VAHGPEAEQRQGDDYQAPAPKRSQDNPQQDQFRGKCEPEEGQEEDRATRERNSRWFDPL
jgi:hypothetical protein